MVRNLLLIIMTFLFSSCFVANYYEQAERLAIVGIIDGVNKAWETYDLVYILDEDTVDVSWANYNEKNEYKRDGHLRFFSQNYCNVVFAATDLPFCCGKPLRGKHQVTIFLRTKKTGNSVLLAKKNIDMSAFSKTVLTTQVYVGLDTSRYVVRNGPNIDWSKAKQLVLEDANDTVFHYTIWLWDKRKECDEMPVEKCIVEIPDHWDLISNH